MLRLPSPKQLLKKVTMQYLMVYMLVLDNLVLVHESNDAMDKLECYGAIFQSLPF
uniref:Uncharacterized protein n=1 Tax=Rhizophora mucronata TaxID=61149 RepID=A0A2P2QQ96_RHIMU